MRKFLPALAAMLVLTSCANAPHGDIAAASQRSGNIYLFRGLIDFLSFGIDRFMRELRAAGFEAAAYSDVQDAGVAAKIERLYANANAREPLILIGYSAGVESALAVAKRLQRSHISVDLLVTLDSPSTAFVPENVRACLNFYEITVPGLPLLSGATLRAGPRVQMENIRLKDPNHFTLDENREMKAAVMARMRALCPLRSVNPAR